MQLSLFLRARTKMHVHNHEQTLYILSGKGIVANEQEEHIATPGTIFLIPSGEKHCMEQPKRAASHICTSTIRKQRPVTRVLLVGILSVVI